MKVITARIDDEFFDALKEIEKDEHTERAEVVRKLLAKAIEDWKLKRSLDLLKEHKVTIRRAAVLAGISYLEMFDLMSKSDIDIGYTLKDLRKDLEEISA
ncbi:hypothetical protein HYY73_06570 [Candidatus Woesearchaeota archaeon]|nr:hypothetical protein [Candidatus Woesearchaeota archaeon]